MIPHPASRPAAAPSSGASPLDIDRSLRLPLLPLLTSAALWLLIASALALVASIKFHSPGFLADTAWLTYGRVRPAWLDALVYGFCLQAGVAVVLWLVTRLGRRTLLGGWAVFLGAVFWNLGLALGIVGVLAGYSTGFDLFELPGYAAVLLFIGWLLVGVPALLTFHYRAERGVFPSQWFILGALFWFPWIFSTAGLLLISYPVRGVAQTVIAWWYAQNLVDVCLTALGLAAAFFFVPRLTARPLYSRYLALFAFWVLLLCTGWGGIPVSAPVPAWMPAVSQAATLLTVPLLLAVALNVFCTRWLGALSKTAAPAAPATAPCRSPADVTSLSFVLVGVVCFVIAGCMSIAVSWLNSDQLLHFTWFSPARLELHVYGFCALVLFGAAYHILPRISGTALPWPKLVRIHFWLAVSGVVLIGLPLAVGGILQAARMADAAMPFMDIVKLTAHFLRVATIGDLLLLVGHGLFFANLAGVLRRLYQARVVPAYQGAAEDLFHVAEGAA